MKVRIDRRAEVVTDLRAELRSLAQSVKDLKVTIVSDEEFERARDDGKFRDFVDVATVEHASEEVLEWVAEELIDGFGWLVDVTRG